MIGRARTDDLAAVMLVERACFEPGDQWSQQAWADELGGGDRLVLVHRDQGDVDAVATFHNTGEVVDLDRVIVHPVARRRGIALALIADGLAWATVEGARRMLLEVAETNVAARGVYAGLRFVEIARRRDYYGPGRSALILQRDLEGAS